MSALTERIAAVVAQHDDWYPNKDQTEWECTCGWQGGVHAVHVAERIEAEFRFTEETRHLEDGSGGISTNWKTGVTTSHCKPATGVRRWVSAWSVVER